jgi:hypothetical protein
MEILEVLHKQSEDPKSLPNLEIEIGKMAGRNREAGRANRRNFHRFTPPYMQIGYVFYQHSITEQFSVSLWPEPYQRKVQSLLQLGLSTRNVAEELPTQMLVKEVYQSTGWELQLDSPASVAERIPSPLERALREISP